mmetsp:Transcript_21095/g.23868  ORF Transcript_21095/g.23868 Transcript_21095/m.23868 type:complete len:423 (-) Transcript_21095:116-1384(-)
MIGIMIILLVTILTCASYGLSCDVYAALDAVEQIGVLDVVVVGSVVSDGVLLMSFAPSYGFFEEILGEFFGVDSLLYQWGYDVACLVASLACLAYLIGYLVVIVYRKLKIKCKEPPAYVTFGIPTDFVSYVCFYGCFCFFPKIIIEINHCSLKVDFNGDSQYYLVRDCNMSCESSQWYALAFLGNIVLFIYYPIATYHRMGYQINEDALVVRQSVQYLALKTVFYPILMFLEKLTHFSPETHVWLFIPIIFSFVVYSFKSESFFNARGPKFLQRGCYVAVLLEAIIAALIHHSRVGRGATLWFGFLAGEIAVISVVTTRLMTRSPRLLIHGRPKRNSKFTPRDLVIISPIEKNKDLIGDDKPDTEPPKSRRTHSKSQIAVYPSDDSCFPSTERDRFASFDSSRHILVDSSVREEESAEHRTD